MKLTPDDSDTDFIRFGKIILWWGHIETQLVDLLFVVHRHPSKETFKGVPVAFEDRIKMLMAAYSTAPRFVSISGEAIAFLKTLQPLHQVRTIIVHGYYQGFTSRDKYLFGFYRARKNDKKGTYTEEFSRSEIDQIIFEMQLALQVVRQLVRKTQRL